jgi:hypothetical protein
MLLGTIVGGFTSILGVVMLLACVGVLEDIVEFFGDLWELLIDKELA